MTAQTLTEPTPTTKASADSAPVSDLPPVVFELRGEQSVVEDQWRKQLVLTFRVPDVGPARARADEVAREQFASQAADTLRNLPAYHAYADARRRVEETEAELKALRKQQAQAGQKKADLLADGSLAGEKLSRPLAEANKAVQDLGQRIGDVEAALVLLRGKAEAAKEQCESEWQALAEQIARGIYDETAQRLESLRSALAEKVSADLTQLLVLTHAGRALVVSGGATRRRLAREILAAALAGSESKETP